MPLFSTIEGQDLFLCILGYTDPIKAIVGFNVLKQRQCYIKYDLSRLFYVLTKEIQLVLPDGPSSPLFGIKNKITNNLLVLFLLRFNVINPFVFAKPIL